MFHNAHVAVQKVAQRARSVMALSALSSGESEVAVVTKPSNRIWSLEIKYHVRSLSEFRKCHHRKRAFEEFLLVRARHDFGGAVLWRALRVLDRSEWPKDMRVAIIFHVTYSFFSCVRFLVCQCPFFWHFSTCDRRNIVPCKQFLGVSASLISCVNFFHVVFYFTLLVFVFVSARMSGFLIIF